MSIRVVQPSSQARLLPILNCWYIVHAYSGMEKAVERNIVERITRSGMQDKFGRILVPTEEVVEMKMASARRPSDVFFLAMFLSK